MPVPIRFDSINLDQTIRNQITTTVAASPSGSSETVIATLTLNRFSDIAVVSGILVQGWAAYTVGTSGASVQFRIRQTNVSGTVVANTGAMTGSQHGAGILTSDDVQGFDSGAGVGVYVMTMTVGSGAAASTVSSLVLQATII